MKKYISHKEECKSLYGHLPTSISLLVFHQIVRFSGIIVACQELFCVVTLLATSGQPHRRRKRENEKSSRLISKAKTLNMSVAHFWQISLPSSNKMSGMAMQSRFNLKQSLLRFRRKYPYRGSVFHLISKSNKANIKRVSSDKKCLLPKPSNIPNTRRSVSSDI